MRFKKGVSPLIATVLLIAFAVSLGAVVMNWGRGYVEATAENAETQSAEKISCSMDTSIGIVQVGNKQKLCIDNETVPGPNLYLNFTLVNTGSVDLEGVQITEIFGNKQPNVTSVKADDSISKSGLYYDSVTLESDIVDEGDFDQLEQIEIAPIILVKGVETVCLEHSLKRLPSEIPICD